MVKKHLASVLLGLGAISPFVAQADQPATKNQNMSQKRMAPQFDMGDPIEPGTAGHPGYVPAAYNYPAGIRAPNQDWDVYLTGSFIYWKPHQDNMFTGVGTNQATGDDVTDGFEGVGGVDLDNTILFSRKPGYKPGFKVGLGWNTGSWDNWTLYGEYTWFHTGNGKDDDEANPCGECGCAEVILVPTCNCPDGIFASDLESKWKLDMDIGDIVLARPAYTGKRLVLSPFFGIRGLWIKQKWDVEYDGVTGAGVPVGEYVTHAHSKAWSVGPRVGVDGSWLLGAGFRLVGNTSASLLYTRYTHLSYDSNIPNGAGTVAFPAPLADDVSWVNQKNYGTVRPNFEVDAGFGWGMYIGDMYHLDFEARYDFHVFWAQNMVSDITNWAVHWVDASPGSLYLHGLTIKARFDF